jgi:hypothetical protein
VLVADEADEAEELDESPPDLAVVDESDPDGVLLAAAGELDDPLPRLSVL